MEMAGRRVAPSRSTHRSDSFLNLCSLADSVTKIVKLTSAYTAVSDYVNTGNIGGMNGKYSFNAYAVRYAADSL